MINEEEIINKAEMMNGLFKIRSFGMDFLSPACKQDTA